MKKALAVALFILAACGTSEAAKTPLIVTEARCIGGYLFAVTYNPHAGWAAQPQLEQILGTNTRIAGGVGEPIKCK